MSHLTYITDDQIKDLLTWPEVFEAVDIAFRSVSKDVPEDQNVPRALQPAKIFTRGDYMSGVLISMPCFVGNYNLPSTSAGKRFETLGCKLVTSFKGNASRGLPTILGTVFLMNPETGKLEAILEGTEITKWRTAAASMVATKYLFFDRPSVSRAPNEGRILSIVGCGVQGESHAIGYASYFGQIKEIRLFNRTTAKRNLLFDKLNSLRSSFKNPNLIITKVDTPSACVQDADIIVIAANSSVPLINRNDLKSDVHINALHHSQLPMEVYNNCSLYPDNWEFAQTALSEIFDKINGIVGDVILKVKPPPKEGISVFQSYGMAVEDVTVAQMILEKLKKTNN